MLNNTNITLRLYVAPNSTPKTSQTDTQRELLPVDFDRQVIPGSFGSPRLLFADA